MFLILLLYFVNSQLYEKLDKLNQSQKFDVIIEEKEKESLVNNVRFDFTFVFPTIINFFLQNRTMNSSFILEVAKQDTRIGVLICQDFQLSIHNIQIELKSLPQYQNKTYQYEIRAESTRNYLTRNLIEVGFSQNQQKIKYFLNMSYETSGIYEIKIHFIYGSGNISLQTCIHQNCSNQFGQTEIFLNYTQIRCISIEQNDLQDFCYHQLEINTKDKSHYELSLKHSTTPLIQILQKNSVSEVSLQNQETFITLSDMEQLNFLYFQTKVKGVFYCGDQRESFFSNLVTIANDKCKRQYDMDQNLYLQHQSKQLKVQYLNSVVKLAMNSKLRVDQQADTYKFFSIETIFQNFIFDIFVFDYPLWVQIYFSNTTEFPNEQNNQFELIESNFKNFWLENQYQLYIGIKTKNQSLEYDISIKEPILSYLNTFQEQTFSYCRTCQIEFKYKAIKTGFIFFHINFEENSDLLKFFFISDGKIIAANSTIILHQQLYVRWSFFVESGFVYTILTKSEIQQKVKILITDERVLRIQNNQELLTIPDYKDEVFIIDSDMRVFLFFVEIPSQLQIENKYGVCNLTKIADNYFEVQFHNNKKEDSVTYFTISSMSPSPIMFRIFKQEFLSIKQISEMIFKSEINYQFIEKKLKISGQLFNYSQPNQVEQFRTIHYILQFQYNNSTTIEYQDHSTFQEYFEKSVDVLQVGPFQEIKSIQLNIEIIYDGNTFKFSSGVPIAFGSLHLQLPEKPRIFSDSIIFLFVILVLLLGYIIIIKKNVNLIHNKKQEHRKISQNSDFYDPELRLEEESEMVSEFE